MPVCCERKQMLLATVFCQTKKKQKLLRNLSESHQYFGLADNKTLFLSLNTFANSFTNLFKIATKDIRFRITFNRTYYTCEHLKSFCANTILAWENRFISDLI